MVSLKRWDKNVMNMCPDFISFYPHSLKEPSPWLHHFAVTSPINSVFELLRPDLIFGFCKLFLYISCFVNIYLYIYIYVCMYVCMYRYLIISVCFALFWFCFFWMRADEKYIKSHVSLPDITLPYLLTVYEFHNFIPFCYLNTEQMKNVDPLFSKNQYGTKSWRGTYYLILINN